MKSLAVCEAQFGSDHPHTATALESHAAALCQAGKAADATKLLDRVIALREQKLGKEHPLVAEALARRAIAELALDKPQLATGSLRQAHDMLTTRFGTMLPPGYRWVADTYTSRLRAEGHEADARKVAANVKPSVTLK